LAEEAVISEPVSARWFPVPREDTGKFGPETVKSHVKNIFAKLGVERRAQAIWRAHSLGIIGASGN
jgi:hypothetical protein